MNGKGTMQRASHIFPLNYCQMRLVIFAELYKNVSLAFWKCSNEGRILLRDLLRDSCNRIISHLSDNRVLINVDHAQNHKENPLWHFLMFRSSCQWPHAPASRLWSTCSLSTSPWQTSSSSSSAPRSPSFRWGLVWTVCFQFKYRYYLKNHFVHKGLSI